MKIQIGLALEIEGALPSNIKTEAELSAFVRDTVEGICDCLNAKPMIAQATLTGKEREALELSPSTERAPEGATIQ